MQIYILELNYWKVKVSMEHFKINVSDITPHMQVNNFLNNNYYYCYYPPKKRFEASEGKGDLIRCTLEN